MLSSARKPFGPLAAIVLGVAFFLVACGWWVLVPTNIAWLDFGDRAMHQLGWMFFRDSPWTMPPGLSPRLGIELANSISLVDGLPLFALPFKLLGPWLPQPFQYWGYWLLLCFALQSLFAYRIAEELGAQRAIAILAAAFALITPAFQFRYQLHLALSGHWIILAALLLYVRRAPPRLWMWPLLGGLTAAIHATLLAMVLSIWIAALVQRTWCRTLSWRRAALELLLGVAGIAGMLWIVGFFGTASYGTYGYGLYRLNLLWPIIHFGWSQVFPAVPHFKYDYEGLGFLGIGIFALLAIAVVSGAVASLREAITRRWLPLTVLLLGLMLFAFSNRLALADIELVTIPVPAIVEALGSAFRSTGRFVWPLVYLVTIGAVVMVGRRLSLAVAASLALVAFTGQLVDSARGWRAFALNMPSPSATWQTELVSPFWDRAAGAGVVRVRTIPLQYGYGGDWKEMGYYAVRHGMDTDTVLLGRVDEARLAALRDHGAEVLRTGAFEPGTLYVLDVYSAMVARPRLGPDDLLATVDRRIVLLRGGKRLVEGLDVEPMAGGD